MHRRLEAFRGQANNRALHCLNNDPTAHVVDKILLTIRVGQDGESYQFALKPMPVRLTYATNAKSAQHECFIPNDAVPMQTIDWRHDPDHEKKNNESTGGTIVHCVVARNNRAPGAKAPLQFILEGTLKWKKEIRTDITPNTGGTVVYLQSKGWTLHFQYAQQDGKLRVVDIEYDTNVGEAEMMKLTEQTTHAAAVSNAQGTKRKTAVDEIKELKAQKKHIALQNALRQEQEGEE